MHLTKLLLALTIAALGAAEDDIEADDVPIACLPACQFTIDLSARCDRSNSDDDEYLSCVCRAADAQARLTECASCVKENGRSDPDDNDVAELVNDCGWNFNTINGPYTTGSTASGGSATTTGAMTATQTSGQTSTTETGTGSSLETSTSAANPASTSPVPTAGAPSAKAIGGSLVAGLVVAALLAL